MIIHEDLHTHIHAVIRDSSDSLVGMCGRLEFCVYQECVAVFEGRWLDLHVFMRAALFHVYKGRKLIRTAGTHINFERWTPLEGRIDRFDLSSYDFCHLLQIIYKASQYDLDEWQCSSIDREYAEHLCRRDVFTPQLLAFLASVEGHRPVYSVHPTLITT